MTTVLDLLFGWLLSFLVLATIYDSMVFDSLSNLFNNFLNIWCARHTGATVLCGTNMVPVHCLVGEAGDLTGHCNKLDRRE